MLNFCDIYSETEVYTHLTQSGSKMYTKFETNNSPKIHMNYELVNYSEKIIPNYL